MEFEGSRNVGSQLRSDHLAPETGYQPRLTLRKKALYEQKSSEWLNESKGGSNYYLRIRTALDENGNVITANYGKIYGNFEFLDFIQAEAVYFNQLLMTGTSNSIRGKTLHARPLLLIRCGCRNP